MKQILLVLLLLFTIFMTGCVAITITLTPHRDMTFDLDFTVTSDNSLLQGMISEIPETSADDTACTQIEHGITCTRKNVVYTDDEGLGEQSPYQDLTYIREKGFLKTKYRIEFTSLGLPGEKQDKLVNVDLEALGAKAEIIIKPFGRITDTNCQKTETGVSCDILQQQQYYVEWSEWFFQGWWE